MTFLIQNIFDKGTELEPKSNATFKETPRLFCFRCTQFACHLQAAVRLLLLLHVYFLWNQG